MKNLFIIALFFSIAGLASAKNNYVLTTMAGLADADWRGGATGKPGSSITLTPGGCEVGELAGTYTQKTVNLNNPTQAGKNVQVSMYFKDAPSNNDVFYNFYKPVSGGDTCTDSASGEAVVYYKYMIQGPSDLASGAEIQKCVKNGSCKDKRGKAIERFKGIFESEANNDTEPFNCGVWTTPPCGIGLSDGSVTLYKADGTATVYNN